MRGIFYLRGTAEGLVIRLATPLSFWGGVEAETGRIIDQSQTHRGALLKAKVLVMPSGRGSSSASSVLAETIRNGTGPIAIVMQRPDPIITAGAMVAHSLYGIVCPVVVCTIDGIADGQTVRIHEDGEAALIEIN
ncbi:aconitase X swivel domain-containing protein [Rhizobium sp. LjRoot254]|uniref:aconitase X swivel domain-containing protein n=1 Tax=Rhizobium sp. LjRoot254 TaxID=3342297 RepID=UPI003ECD6D37